MSERARAIFLQVVENYLRDGQPVGSKTLASGETLNLSPASIRAVLAELEAAGLLAAPHTSAGRMPTTAGLRLFVEGMMQVSTPTRTEREAIRRRLAESGPIEALLEQTSAILSDLSGAAGMVLVPARDPVLQQFTLVPLGAGKALAVIVGADGQIENRVLALEEPVDEGAFERASNYLSTRLSGKSLSEAASTLRAELASGAAALDLASRTLVERGLAIWSEDAAKRPVLIVRGQARLLDDAMAADLERVRQLLDELEDKRAVAQLLDQARQAEATRIFIGADTPLFALSGSSVIASPYRDGEGRVVGVLGVIGPTRLNYARLVPMVDFTARSLSKFIG